MKTAAIALSILLIVSCNDHSDGATSKTSDSVTVNTTETNKADGGPNNGLGDTNAHAKVNDTLTHDTLNKK